MFNKLILFSGILFGSICLLPNETLAQDCPGSIALMEVLNPVRVSQDVFSFEVWFYNTNPAIPMKTASLNGALTGIDISSGTFAFSDPGPNKPPGGIVCTTPVVNSLRALRFVQTNVDEGSAVPTPLSSTKFGTFTFTRSGGPALPAGAFDLSWTTTGASVPSLVGFCNGNTNPSNYTFGNGRLTVSTPAVTIPESPLPIELIDFNALAKPTSNHITWSTGSERNSKWHIIERSDASFDWKEIGRVAAKGNSNTIQRYSLEDIQPLPLSNYRLKALDIDGSFKYSKVVSVQRKTEGFSVISVFPTPTKGPLTLQVNIPEAGNLNISVTDINGRLLLLSDMDANDGLNQIPLDLSDFAAGVYFVKINNGFKLLTERVVKQ